MNILALSNSLDSLIPISRFNRGEANKILDEVNASGVKTIVKNNKPACILLSIEGFKSLVEKLDDKYLLSLAMERDNSDSNNLHSADKVYRSLDIPDDADDEIPMEYGVDFE